MNIILVGFMGTGKSSVGERLSKIIGKKYFDVDKIIEEREKRSIPEIFSEKGEDYFRRVESEVIKELAKTDESVISTGGGAIVRKENLENLRRKGLLICLTARPEVILKRTEKEGERPLLDAALDKRINTIKKLLEKREPFYKKADVTIDTSFLSVSQVVDEIVKILKPERLFVDLKERGYPVFIGFLLEKVGEIAKNFASGRKVLIVSDTNVFPLYGEATRKSLEERGFDVYCLQVPAGEKSKSLGRVRKIYDFCLSKGFDRGSSILALGGGVVGDLAGFAAATFMRGIRFYMVPTTLLSQVDSGVGGKVGVNLPQGKNLVGAFYQPKFVLIDPVLLRTLSLRRIREGLAEIIKCAIIKNGEFFSYLEDNISKIISRDIGIIKEVIKKAVKVKMEIVEEDEKEEKGLRQVLNFGHTIAHAIEKVSGYRRYTHGEAVAVGMVGEAKIGREMGILPATSFERIKNLVEKAGLPLKAKGVKPEEVMDALKVDKKKREDKIFFVLPKDIGDVFLTSDVPPSIVRKVLREIIDD